MGGQGECNLHPTDHERDLLAGNGPRGGTSFLEGPEATTLVEDRPGAGVNGRECDTPVVDEQVEEIQRSVIQELSFRTKRGGRGNTSRSTFWCKISTEAYKCQRWTITIKPVVLALRLL